MLGPIELALIGLYAILLGSLGLLGLHRLGLVLALVRRPAPPAASDAAPDRHVPWPTVTVQLPVFNERYVAERLVRAVAAMDYPSDRLEIQILDDSTDDTTPILGALVERLRAEGHRVLHRHRAERTGFKAGALAAGMADARGELIAIFDADFIPNPDWLRRVVPSFLADDRLGMVQTRWAHRNATRSLLTRLQAIFLDAHFGIEHAARDRLGCYFNFNGTAGIWRRAAIDDAGGWSAATLTEDLDLSYRAQLAGWRFRYLDDVRVPAELPEEMSAYRTQQARWSQGAIQVLRRLGPRLLLHRASTPRQKFEALAHLGCNFSYVLMFALSLLLPPVLVVRQRYGLEALGLLDAVVFAAGTLSVGWFYFLSQRREGTSRTRALLAVPLVMSFGIGMSLNNGRAVLAGLIGKVAPFRRTAKYGDPTLASRRAAPHWIDKDYVTTAWRAPLLEAALALYCAGALHYSLLHRAWPSVPFLLLFVAGYGLTATASAWQLWAVRRHRVAFEPRRALAGSPS